MDDKGSVGKISVSSDSVSTLNSEDFVLVSRLGDETPSSTNNGSDDEKTGLKVRTAGLENHQGVLRVLSLLGWSITRGHVDTIIVFFFFFSSVFGLAACKTSLPSQFASHLLVYLL